MDEIQSVNLERMRIMEEMRKKKSGEALPAAPCSPSLDVANALRKARGEKICDACQGRGWNEIDTGDGRSDGNIYSETCDECNGIGIIDYDMDEGS